MCVTAEGRLPPPSSHTWWRGYPQNLTSCSFMLPSVRAYLWLRRSNRWAYESMVIVSRETPELCTHKGCVWVSTSWCDVLLAASVGFLENPQNCVHTNCHPLSDRFTGQCWWNTGLMFVAYEVMIRIWTYRNIMMLCLYQKIVVAVDNKIFRIKYLHIFVCVKV